MRLLAGRGVQEGQLLGREAAEAEGGEQGQLVGESHATCGQRGNERGNNSGNRSGGTRMQREKSTLRQPLGSGNIEKSITQV